MNQQAKLDFGDEIRILEGEHKGRTGAVVGVNDPNTPSILTIEFEDGSDAEVPLGFLERLPD